MVARLIDTDIDTARAHADAAVRRAGRVPAVREARGLVAYHEGDWSVALAEFRTARRLSGSHHLLPYLVDCERALGRPEKALDLARSPEATSLPAAERAELRIVRSGIRRDLGQPEAALSELEGPHLVPGRTEPWAPRLYYAYADALLELGRTDDAQRWFLAAAQVDEDLTTDAWERLDELDGTVLVDLLEDDEESAVSGEEDGGQESGASDEEPGVSAGEDRGQESGMSDEESAVPGGQERGPEPGVGHDQDGTIAAAELAPDGPANGQDRVEEERSEHHHGRE